MMHTGRELLRLLKANGFEVVSVRGSHYKMRHADGVLSYFQAECPKLDHPGNCPATVDGDYWALLKAEQ